MVRIVCEQISFTDRTVFSISIFSFKKNETSRTKGEEMFLFFSQKQTNLMSNVRKIYPNCRHVYQVNVLTI